MTRKRTFPLLVLLVLLLLAVLPTMSALAQDLDKTPEPEPIFSPVTNAEAAPTGEPVVVLDQTAETAAGATIVTIDSSSYETLMGLILGGSILIVIVISYVQHKQGREFAKMVPPDVHEFYKGVTLVALGLAQAHVNKTPSDLDNKLLEALIKQLGLPIPQQNE